MTTRIAMWSGPRNISAAMMRSWDNRRDTVVCDETLYAHYLQQTGLPHPGAAETIVHHESNLHIVIERLFEPLPNGKSVFYQKQMAHHLLPGMEIDWIDALTNCFLIREPREMLTSLIEFLPEPRVEDTGLPQQAKMFKHLRERYGTTPTVLDANIHHNNLINSILAKIHANAAGADDALMLDARGFVAETNATHVFLVHHGTVLTPRTTACPEGITRSVVLELCVTNHIPHDTRDLSLTEFFRADEMFCTGTMGELAPVIEVDGRSIGDRAIGPMTLRLSTLFAERTAREGTQVAG